MKTELPFFPITSLFPPRTDNPEAYYKPIGGFEYGLNMHAAHNVYTLVIAFGDMAQLRQQNYQI